MKDLFKAELLRFRNWALIAATVHAVALGFMSRLVDLAQQPMQVYQVIGMVYAVVGTLFGLYQMGTYRRPNQWLNLLHRPMHRLQIAGALCSAGALLLLAAVALPIVVIATYQETLTARVVDMRHWLMPIAALLIALCGYLAGAYAMLAPRRYGWTVVMLPTLLIFAFAHGVGALAVQAVVLLFLVALLAIAFKPDLSASPPNPLAVVAVALPAQVGVHWLLWMLLIGGELVWTLAGNHPLSAPTPPRGGFIEADRAEGKDALLAGIASSRGPEAPLWREQIALSDVYQLYPFRALPLKDAIGNMMPMEFDDEERNIRWVFSHDRMRFIGYSTLDRRARGELGVGADNAAFPRLVLPFTYMLGATGVYQYDPEQQRVFPRAALTAGEVFASTPEPAGDNIAMLSDRALYFYPGREAANGYDLLKPLLRVPLPGVVGTLSRVDMVELLDGYLLSFTFTNGAWSGRATPYQQVLRVDGDGKVHEVARRELALDLPAIYTFRHWWLSPAIYAVCVTAQDLFATHNPLREQALTTVPRGIRLLAGGLSLLSLLAAIWLTGRQVHSPVARWSWVIACGVVGVPALVSLWLLYPPRERTEDLPLTQSATA